MAAPSGIKWGSTVGDYGKIGIYVKLTKTDTQVVRLVEVWFASKYSVSDTGNTFYYDCATDASSAKTSKGAVSISTTHDSGDGWDDSNEIKLKSYSHTYTRGTSDVTYKIYAKLADVDRVGGTMSANTSFTIPALESFKVTYNANGGSGAPSAQTKYYGKTLTLSSTKPTRSGYTFVGWGTSADDTSSNYSPGGTYTANAADTLYAIWKKTITLSYGANSGTGAPGSQSATVYNATTSYKFTLSTTKPTRTGYTFLGWSTSSSATSASYAAGGTITLSSSDTLYAVWRVNTFTVNYYSNYADYCELDVAVSLSTNVKVSSYNFSYATAYETGLSNYTSSGGAVHMTRTGYTGTGNWNTKADGSGTTVNEGTSFASGQKVAEAFGKSIKTGDASVNVYAQWKINTYTVSYNANGGTGAPSAQTKTYGKTLTLSSTKPTRTNYTFQGWGTSSTDTSVDYNAGGSYTTNKAVTLYAIWKLNTYTISYNLNGGSGTVASQTKTHGTNLTLTKTVPTRSNYKFLGWGVSSSDTSATYQPGGTFTSNANTTLYAVWERLGIAHINVNGTWNKGRIYVNDNWVWKTGLIFKNVDGTWKQGGA